MFKRLHEAQQATGESLTSAQRLHVYSLMETPGGQDGVGEEEGRRRVCLARRGWEMEGRGREDERVLTNERGLLRMVDRRRGG